MTVSCELFLNWAHTRFPVLKVRGKRVRVDSIFVEDCKQHLWCRPYTGKYHCYKSGTKGSLIDLVRLVENCSYTEAVALITEPENTK